MSDRGYSDATRKPPSVARSIAKVARQWISGVADLMVPYSADAPVYSPGISIYASSSSPPLPSVCPVPTLSHGSERPETLKLKISETLDEYARTGNRSMRDGFFRECMSSGSEETSRAIHHWTLANPTNRYFFVGRDIEMANFIIQHTEALPVDALLNRILSVPQIGIVASFQWRDDHPNTNQQYQSFKQWRKNLQVINDWLDWFFYAEQNNYWIAMGLTPCPLLPPILKTILSFHEGSILGSYLFQYIWKHFGNVKGEWNGRTVGILQFPVLREIVPVEGGGRQWNVSLADQYARCHIFASEVPTDESSSSEEDNPTTPPRASRSRASSATSSFEALLRDVQLSPRSPPTMLSPIAQAKRKRLKRRNRFLPPPPKLVKPGGFGAAQVPSISDLVEAFIFCGGTHAETLMCLLQDKDLDPYGRNTIDNVGHDIVATALSMGATSLIEELNIMNGADVWRPHSEAAYLLLEQRTRPDARAWLAHAFGLGDKYASFRSRQQFI